MRREGWRGVAPLPATSSVYTEVKKATVYVDYHVEVDGHYYSVPHRLVGEKVETHASAHSVRDAPGGTALPRMPGSHRQGGL